LFGGLYTGLYNSEITIETCHRGLIVTTIHVCVV